MKEITFEELIEEISPPYVVSDEGRAIFGDLFNKPRDIFSKKELLNLMEQVREATIAECRECLTLTGHDDIPLHWIEQKYKMNQLPTDRIKTEK